MSLLVWLPLDGSLRNLGISGNSLSLAAGQSFVTSGKISSQCLKTSTNQDLLYNGNQMSTTSLSFGGWFKFVQSEISSVINGLSYTSTASTATGQLIGNNSYGGISLQWNSNNIYSGGSFSSMSVQAYLRTSTVGAKATSSYTIPFDQWVHIFLVCDKENLKCSLYINGALFNSFTFVSFSDAPSRNLHINYKAIAGGNGPSANIPFYCNDVRIYNHALSAAEVKEISQGLILHYKLDSGLFGNPNLLARYVVPGQNGPTSTAAAGRTKWLGDYKIEIPATENADTYFRLFMTEQLVANTTYTISCKVSGLLSGSYYKFPLFGQGNSGMGVLNLDHNGLCSLTFTMTYTGTQTAVTGADGETVYINFLDDSARAIATGQGPITVYDFKLEKGDNATPFVPSGSFHTIIQDSSGYNNNSVLNKATFIDSNTVKYLYSTYFGDYNTPVATLNNTSLLSSLSDCTITWWGKYDTSKTLLLTGQSTSHYLAASDNNTYYHRNATVTTFYKDGVPGSYKCAADGWHFFAMTGVDISSWTTLKINGYSSGWPLKGFISDFRIYATSLLDSDIKQLYNLGMKVDKEQNIHVFELQENNSNLFSALPWTTSYSTHSSTSNLFTNFNEQGEPQFTSGGSAGSNYIEIVPGVYEYDYTISVNAGNKFYIGFERYDANKTSRSNNACAYTWTTKPSSDIVKTRYKGTINLTTDGTNPIKYIALRILNGWSGTTSGVTGKATIHNFSLRLKSIALEPSIYKQGRQLFGDEFKEDAKASFYKDHIVEANEFIER